MINCIAAVGKRGQLGLNGKLPWNENGNSNKQAESRAFALNVLKEIEEDIMQERSEKLMEVIAQNPDKWEQARTKPSLRSWFLAMLRRVNGND